MDKPCANDLYDGGFTSGRGDLMLWIDLIDMLYLLIGVIVGYVLCSLVNRDLLDDECESCEYREFIEEVLNDE